MFRMRPFIARSLIVVLALTIVPLLAACGGSEEAEVGQLPTRFVAPTDPPTATATATDPSSPTPLATFTATNTPSLTPTDTLTTTPTLSPTPSLSPTPRATATFTLTPPPTATNTPIPTATPIASATPNTPQINSFEASAASVAGGTPITLTWQAVGDIARIDQLGEQGTVQQTFSVQVTGQLPVTVPNTGGQVIYRLTVQRGGQEVSRSIPVQVQVTCAIPWFFGAQLAPPEAGCPLAAQTNITGKLQVFERGIMLNLSINAEDRVYGLNGQNNRYMVYRNNWDGVTTYTVPCGTAPAGLQNPQDVFNWAYHNTLGTVGLWCDATNSIGWAVAPANLSVSFTVQFEATGTGFYIGIPGFSTVRISGEPQTGTWQRLGS
ncbi:MAG: hypothetical protein ACOCYT_03950 [Chloroflexota bacterium]